MIRKANIRTISFAACLIAMRLCAVTVEVDKECAGMGEVFWSEQAAGGGMTRLTLEAKAKGGHAFSGWSVAGAGDVGWPADIRYPAQQTLTVSTAAVVTASFIPNAEDYLEFDFAYLFTDEIECYEKIEVPLDVDSQSFPTLAFSGLPPGISYKSSTLTLSGSPTTPGVYRVVCTGVNGSWFTFQDYFTLRVGNVSGSYVTGEDVEIPLDEYYEAEFAESQFGDTTIFSCSEGWKKVDLSGLPPGLTWNGESDWEVVSGTPTKTGDYTVTARVTLSNEMHEVATLIMSVVAPDPDEFDVDLDGLEDMHIGDVFEYQSNVIGKYDVSSGLGIQFVTGLPPGLTTKTWTEGGARYWGIEGRATKPGRYEISVKVAVADGEGKKMVDTRRTIVVRDIPDVYFSAETADAAKGSVLGGGVVSPAEDVSVFASAKPGYVFSGWYDVDGEAVFFDDGTDYRAPTVTLAAGTDFSLLSLVANFISSEDDEAPEFIGLDGEEYSVSADGTLAEAFEVDSISLPVLTFKGLPTGVTCEPNGSGAFALEYDGSTAPAQLAPGRYTVTATATNRSGRQATATFLITVTNIADPRIRVPDDFGEFEPGEEIEPIDLSEAVDFGAGETLAVSGLPKGLTYNAKANEKKGIAAYTITGTPTAPGYCTLTFTAKVAVSVTTNARGKVSYKYETVKVTSFMTVLPYPELLIEMDEGAGEAGNKISGGGNYKPGTKVTLKATAAKGWVFAGWDGLDGVGSLEALNPKLSYVTTDDDVFVYANFIEVRDDWLYVAEPDSAEAGYAAELALNEPIDESDEAWLIADLIETGSYPTVKVVDLPKGLKFSATTFMLSGKPTKSGVYHATVTVKNAGGYSFVRVLDIAVLEKAGTLPEDAKLPNEADIDFEPIAKLMTGGYCPTGAVVLAVGAQPGTGASVKKAALSGLPAGLTAAITMADGEADIEITGTPTKPGRQILTVKVTYNNGKSATSQCAVVVRDGGSYYLDVQSLSEDGGTVSGSGVYASGAKVSLSAKAKSKHVFAGWLDDNQPFAALPEIDGIDYRTASVSFVFRPDMLADSVLYGDFASSEEDDVAIDFAGDVWDIAPQEASAFAFAVDSKSLPKLTAKGLPKGVTMDAARGWFHYEPNVSAVPGIYTVTVSAQNSTVKKAVADSFEIRLANRTSEVIGGLDPDMDAYCIAVGTELDPNLIMPEVDEDWKLSVKGLPSGLSYKNDVISGVPSKTGDYTVTFTATTGKGVQAQTEVATITIRVAALPMMATGTFNGFLTDEEEVVIGTITVSATAVGKVSATIEVPSKRLNFSAKAWDAFSDGKAESTTVGKGDSELVITIDANGAWTDWQLDGICQVDGVSYAVTGQRNSYGKKDGMDEARAAIEQMAGTSTSKGWTAKISKDGVVKMTGKYDGKSISGTATMMYNDGFFARYIKFIDKKHVLSVSIAFDDNGTIQSVEDVMY